jgi:hypothetical protein
MQWPKHLIEQFKVVSTSEIQEFESSLKEDRVIGWSIILKIFKFLQL